MIFNLQLFTEQLEMAGIDEDILKELGVDTTPAEEEPQPAEPVSNGEADTDNKQVEEQAQENDDEIKEGQTIPYDRFRSVNERRKTAESRIKELEEQLKALQSQPKQEVEAPAQVQSPAPVNMYDYTAEQRKKITELAIQRAKKNLGLTDEDVEALEYADDVTEKIMYQNAIVQETQAISREIQDFKNRQDKEQAMYSSNVDRFNQLNAKVAAYPDAQARIKFIMNENFTKLDAEKQLILQESFKRLQEKQGTNADYRLINSYFTKANKLWEEAHGYTPTNTNNKVTQAQKLPKAPNINGGGGNDRVYTIAELTEIMNSKGGWESLPQKVKEQILKGNMPV